MSALVLLEGLNDLLDDAARTAEDLEREIDGALPPRETREERKRLRRERSEREPFGGACRQEGSNVGPGAYDTSVAVTVVGKRVSGGRWGGGRRWKDAAAQPSHSSDVGPGQYDPNQSFVLKKRPGVKIVAPTTKTLAAHLRAFERQEEQRGLGPGRYTPSLSATSDWAACPGVAIAPKAVLSDKLKEHLLKREELQAPGPGAYDTVRPETSSSAVGVLQWRPESGQKRDQDYVPGPSDYEPDWSAVRAKTTVDVRLAPSESGSITARSVAKERSSFIQASDGPGPGAYHATLDSVKPNVPSAVMKSHYCKSLKPQSTGKDGDILVLNPNDDYTRPSIRCSAVMREASFVSQASTVVADEAASERESTPRAELSILSTKHRTPSFSMDGQSRRLEPKHPSMLAPGYYKVKYDAVDAEPRATRVLQSTTLRVEPANKSASADCKLVLDSEKADQFLRTSHGVPDFGKSSSRPDAVPGQKASDFTGDGNYSYDATQATRVLNNHTPTVDMRKMGSRKAFAMINDSNPALGPGKYDADDSLLHPRVQAAFISDTPTREEVFDEEGDRLVLEPRAADGLIRRRSSALVNIEKTTGRAEPKKEAMPEALDYAPDVVTEPHVQGGFKFEQVQGRVEPKQATEGAHLFGKYKIDYSQVETQSTAVDFAHGSSRRMSGDEETQADREGDILSLEPEKAHSYLRGSFRLVPDLAKQTSRPDAVAGQVMSEFTGDEDYDAAEAKRALWNHTPGFDIGKMAARADVDKDSDPRIGPGKYDADDSLLHPRVQAAFISDTPTREEVFDEEGDRLVLEPRAADGLIRRRSSALVNIEKTTGRAEPKKEAMPEALDYAPDVVTEPHVQGGFKFEQVQGRVEPKQATEGAHLFGKYKIDYSQVETQSTAVDFAHGSSRRMSGDEETQADREGDILSLEPEKAHSYLRGSFRLVPDLAKQTSRPDAVAGQVMSEFTGDEDYDAAEAKRALWNHTPGFDMGKATERTDESQDLQHNSKLGPGTYDADDAMLHPRAPVAFISTSITLEADVDWDGDVLDLEVSKAEESTRRRVPALVDMHKGTGRVEPKLTDKKPEALDYAPDCISAPMVKGSVKFEDQTDRPRMDGGMGEGSHLQGTYVPDFSLVEAKTTWTTDFGLASSRTPDGASDHLDTQDGDVLDLDPARGESFLRPKKLVPDMQKQLDRPDEVAGQRMSECDPESEYEPNLAAIAPHKPVVEFSKVIGRKEDNPDQISSNLGPGVYGTPNDALLHPRTPAVSFGEPPVPDSETENERHEGDILVLHPEDADKVTRPVMHGFTNLFQPSALDTDWAKKEEIVKGSDGETKTLPSLRKRVNWHRLARLIDDWNRPVVYDTHEADKWTRARVYQESIVDMTAQIGHTTTKLDLKALGAKLDFVLEKWNQDESKRTYGLPRFRHIYAGGQICKAEASGSGAGSVRKGDTLVMITAPNGRSVDFRRWAHARAPPANDILEPPPRDTSRIVSQLGPWRECAVDVSRDTLSDRGQIAPSGLKWRNAGTTRPTQGRELDNHALSTALASKTELTPSQWESYGVNDLTHDDFIKVGSTFFKPVQAPYSTFFFHVGTGKRSWIWPLWGRPWHCDSILQMLDQTLQDFGYPVTLHVQRPRSHCTIAVPIRELDDSMSGAYTPKHALVEAGPKGVSDFVNVAGRDLSFDAKSKYELFKSNLYFHAKRTTPTQTLITDKELDAVHAQQEAALRAGHEQRVRDLTRRQEIEYAQEMAAIPSAALPTAAGRDRGRVSTEEDSHEAKEDLFESMMTESVLGEEEERRAALVAAVEKRQATERKRLRAAIRREQESLREAQSHERVHHLQSSVLRAEVEKAAHINRLGMTLGACPCMHAHIVYSHMRSDCIFVCPPEGQHARLTNNANRRRRSSRKAARNRATTPAPSPADQRRWLASHGKLQPQRRRCQWVRSRSERRVAPSSGGLESEYRIQGSASERRARQVVLAVAGKLGARAPLRGSAVGHWHCRRAKGWLRISLGP